MNAATPISDLAQAAGRSGCLALARAYFDGGGFLADLRRRVAYETVSDTAERPPALRSYLIDEIVPALAGLGFERRVVDNAVAGAPPMLIAARVEDESLPTVLTYGHGDVVSAHAAQWREGIDPWQVRCEGNKWYGRGSADNKGQHTINLAGLAAALQARQGRLGYNVKVLLEMGEEAGSPGLRETCIAHADALRADLFLACDGPRLNAATPTVFLGSRGAVNFSLRLRARDRAYHSGNWGGVLLNPALVLAHALTTLVDAQGRILVPELRPAGLDAGTRRVLEHVVIGADPDDPVLDAGWGEPGLSAAERLMGWNTLEVLALGAGQPARPVNAIPALAEAHCQLRFVEGTPWQDLEPILQAHLERQGFGQIEVKAGMSAAASRLDPNDPWVTWLCDSILASTGTTATVLPNLAGTLPNDIFAQTLGLPTLWIPHSYPACAQHAPNEHLLADVALQGLQIMAGVYWDLGERRQAPWSRELRP
jgi:acetylornithine deacetylase/succinyl-diaminopimelate desuccinylase-like protein